MGINDPIVSTFVDNIKVMETKRTDHIERVKAKLAAEFEMVDIGLISFYLGLKVERDWQKQILKLSQPSYIEKILEKYHLYLAKPCSIPIKKGIQFLNKEPKGSQAKQKRY